MNKNKRGISMISLVIIIVVTTILLGVAITAGYRYIEVAKRTRAQALSLTIGDAAYRRQNDMSSGLTEQFYEGYVFDLDKDAYDAEGHAVNKYDLIEGLPDKRGTDGIPDVLQGSGDMWYMIDADSASSLGSPGADEMLTRNISYNATADNTMVDIVLVDYFTGNAYYVTMPAYIATGSISHASGPCPTSLTGNHKFTVVTCVDDSKCIYCGYVNKKALGHDWVEPTCTTDGYCKRCHVTGKPATGHEFIKNMDYSSYAEGIAKRGDILVRNDSNPSANAWVANSDKHWHECLVCGYRAEEEQHTIEGYGTVTNTHHQKECGVCGWRSIEAPHTFGDPVIETENTHKVTCTACLFSEIHDELETTNPHTHTHTAWYADCEEMHYRVCSETDTSCNKLKVTVDAGTQKSVAFKENHIDSNKDYYCDVCGRGIDRKPPKEFNDEDYGSYARFKSSTTSTITIEAYTIDEEQWIDYYQFGRFNPATNTIVWEDSHIAPTSPTSPVEYTFTNLSSGTDYVFYVRAFDKEGNSNTPAMVRGTTAGFPEFAGVTGMPTQVVKGPIQIGIQEIKTDIEGLYVQYRQNDGDWSSNISLSDLTNTKITLSNETEKIEFRIVDSKTPNPNISPVVTYTTNYIDNTPPVVTITSKAGDNPSQSAAHHFATVTVADTEGIEARAGIAQDTVIKYAWSTSGTVVPTIFDKEIRTSNTATATSVSVDIETPTNVKGTYYLWVQRGIVDAVGNATTQNKVSSMAFVIDDEEAILTNITMLDVVPDSKVPNEHLFVKTNGEVTVTFTTDKELKQNPVVRLNNVNMEVTKNGLNYTCKLTIDSSFDEGTLQLYIGDVVSINGRISERTYTNADITSGRGPVYYDKTPPVLEYIPKKG